MALIKKHSSGGDLKTRDSFSEYVNQRLLTNADNLTAGKQRKLLDTINEPGFDPEISQNKDANNMYKDYKNFTPHTREVDLSGGKPLERSTGSLLDYIVDNDYKGNREYGLRKIAEMTGTDEQGFPDNTNVKKYIIGKMGELANKYTDHMLSDNTGSN